MSKILFITNVIPSPLDNGGKIFVNSFLECLKKLKYDIDLVGFYDSSDKKPNLEQLNKLAYVHIIKRNIVANSHKAYTVRKMFGSLFSPLSYGVYKFNCREMKSQLKLLCETNNYEFVFFGSLCVYSYAQVIKKYLPNTKIILCEQNCEVLIMERRKDNTKNVILKTFLSLEVKKLRNFESKALVKSNFNFILSNEDRLNLEKNCKKSFKYEIVPIAVKQLPIKQNFDVRESIELLFVGTMTWAPNVQGIEWFCENVMPYLENVNLTIIGKGASNKIIELAKTNFNINYLGYVDDLNEYFEKCNALVVPLFIGSGQRVKIIEAFSRGMPVISTSIGAEGLQYSNNENMLIANTKDQFISTITSLKNLDLRSISTSEKKLYNCCYSIDSVSNKIYKTLKCEG